MKITTISATTLRRHFQTVFDQVAIRKEPCIITHKGKAEVVMIPHDLWLCVEPIIEGCVHKADLYFNLGDDDDSSADEFLNWRERQRKREMQLEQATQKQLG